MKFIERIWAKRRALHAKKIDLRHFRHIQLSDSWDGEMTCSDGLTTRLVFYKDEVVLRTDAWRDHGSVEARRKSESTFWSEMSTVAGAYMTVVKAANALYFGKPAEHDTFLLGNELMDILRSHPQFIKSSQELGIVLRQEPDYRWKISVTRSYIEAA
ncbi:MAG: hypothetical protein JWL82_118 [Parcubacteria group bacterium]|nr:hypothetical protein [Parcubacteria group bacterium]